MESLLKMSGLLSDEEAGKTDLGTLERRLAEKASTFESQTRSDSAKPTTAASSTTVQGSRSPDTTPQNDNQSSPRTLVASPTEESSKDRREEVENLSDLMCSLVTNNCGETRYIGRTALSANGDSCLLMGRFIIRSLHFLAERH